MSQRLFLVVITAPDDEMTASEAAENLRDVILDGLGFPDEEIVSVAVKNFDDE